MNCPYCNNILPDGSLACPACGASFVQQQPQIQYQQPRQPYQQPYPQQHGQYNMPQQQIYYQKPQKKNEIGIVTKVLLISIGAFFLIPFLFRCGRSNDRDDDSVTITTTTTQAPITDTSTQNDADTVQEYSETIPFEEIYNDKGIVIKTTSYEHTPSKVTIGFYIENNSEMNIDLTAHSYSVNDVTINNNTFDMYTSVTKGNKANSKLEISTSDIDSPDSIIKNIEILFWIYDEDKGFKDFETDIIEIKTSMYGESITQIVGEDVFENEELTVSYINRDENSFNFIITNNSSSYFDFDLDGLTINGYTFTGYDFDNIDICVFSNNQASLTITPEKEFLNDNQITDIEKIEFNIKYRIEGTYTNEKKTDVITYTLN